MAFWLKSEERRVAARGRRVRGDLLAVDAARRRFAGGVREQIRRPKVLLAFFAAGLGFGWLRPRERGPARATQDEGDGPERTGRIAKAVAAVLAGARIYEQLRHAAALVDSQGYRGAGEAVGPGPGATAESAPFREYPSDQAQQREAHQRYEARE